MGYSSEPDMVRVDIFKPSGKWYDTIDMKWVDYDGPLLHDTFTASLIKGGMSGRYQGFMMICLEPYHKHAYPIMIKEWNH